MTRRHAILLAAVVLLLIAAGLRFHALDSQSLWNDEGSSYGQSLRTPEDIIVNAAADIHPPGYYLLLAGWRVLTGESESALRALSAFASLIGAAFTFAVGRRLYGGIGGLVALGVVALNTFSIYYAQEARMYALLAAISAAATWALVEGLHGGRWRIWVAYALLCAAGAYTNYAFAGVIAAHVVLVVIWAGMQLRSGRVFLPTASAWIAAGAGAVILYLPWLPTALRQVTSWGSTGQPTPIPAAVNDILGLLTGGITVQTTGLSVGAVMLVLFGLLMVRRGAIAESNIAQAWGLAVPMVWVLLTVVGFLMLDLYRPANLKFLLPAQLGVALWIGRGAAALWAYVPEADDRRQFVLRAAACVAVGAFALGQIPALNALYTAPIYQRDDYRGIVQAILTDGAESPGVIVSAPGQIEVVGYYAERLRLAAPLIPLPVGLTVDEVATLAVLEAAIQTHDRLYGILWGADERDPTRLVERTLADEAFQVDDRWFGAVRLARYATATLSDAQTIDAAFAYGEITLTLETVALSAEDIAAGEILGVELVWRADGIIAEPLVVTVQLLNPDGTLAAQRDSQPAAGNRPTQTWTVGEPITDRHGLMIPEGLAPAQYRLMVAVYNPSQSGTRLPIEGSDALIVGEIQVSASQGGQ